MSVEDAILTILLVAAFSGIVVAANIADRDKRSGVRGVVFAVLILINVMIIALYGVMQVVYAFTPVAEGGDLTAPGKTEAVVGLVLSVIVAGLAGAVLHPRSRERLAGLLPAPRPAGSLAARPQGLSTAALNTHLDGTPLFPQMLNYYTTDDIVVPRPSPVASSARVAPGWFAGPGGSAALRGFDKDSTVHVVALVACIYLVGVQFINFALGGGLEGVAESFEGGLTAWDLLLNAFPLLVIPVLGVGLGIRRTLPQALERLGLKRLDLESTAVAFGATISLLIFVAAVSMVWMGVVSEETYEEQTEASEALAESVSSLGIAFLLAATAAIAEEIAFRGALQPVIGFWPTAIAFALTHAQYTLTPATLIILVVAIAFGWIRNRYSTTAAILTHFLYNFIPLALSLSVVEEGSLWWLHLAG